jgi:hypothetical protein
MLPFVVFALLLAAPAAPAAAQEDIANKPIADRSSVTQRHAMRAAADPETGELVAPEGAEMLTVSGSGAAEAAPLELVPAPTDAGGVMVDLRGQFRHETRARAVDGNVSADCIPASSPP